MTRRSAIYPYLIFAYVEGVESDRPAAGTPWYLGWATHTLDVLFICLFSSPRSMLIGTPMDGRISRSRHSFLTFFFPIFSFFFGWSSAHHDASLFFPVS